MHVAAQNATLPLAQQAILGDFTPPHSEITTGHRKTVKLRSRRPTSLMSSQSSAEDKPLFMAARQSRKHQRSLSPIGNREAIKKNRQSDPSLRSLDDPASENMTWDIINREIAEWQNNWQTGRPSWWSSASKATRRGAHSTWQEEFQAIPPWRLSPDHTRRPKQRYDEQRRAVTDSYLADNNNAQDLARLIAIQLLSACFTLPPEQMANYKSTAYHCFQTLGFDDLQDSRLISSLRMHTEARYSPSFGHQAPNTSPDMNQMGECDYRFPSRSRRLSSGHESLDFETLVKPSRRGRIHRALHMTENSANECSMPTHSKLSSPDDFQQGKFSRGWQRSEEDADSSLDLELPLSDESTDRSLQSPKLFDFKVWHTSPIGSRKAHWLNRDTVKTSKGLVIPSGPPRRSLESVIRSEPHHVYIQPVKELVVKRWQTLRRRVGKSLSHGHHDQLGTGLQTAAATASPDSENGQIFHGSPAYSSDRKERRRQARERGDIHSSSAESNPHYNTLTSAGGSGAVSPADLGGHPLSHHYPDAQWVATAIANALSPSEKNTGLSTTESMNPPTQIASDVPVPSTAVKNSLDSRRGSVHATTPSKAVARPLQPLPSKSARRPSQRRHRKSMLSEMCTAEDLEEEIGLVSALGSALDSPREESRSDIAMTSLPQTPTLSRQDDDKPGASSRSEGIEYPLELDKLLEIERARERFPRPGIVRTSTSGTQIFTPGKDGVEVDGLPVGPTADEWDEKGRGNQRIERNYL